MTKGNTVKKKADVYNMPQRDIIFRTTKNAHILKLTLSTGQSQGGGWGERGGKLAYSRFRVGPKDCTHKKLYIPKITD